MSFITTADVPSSSCSAASSSLKELTLRSITLPDLSLLLPLRDLRALDLKLGGTRNLDLLPEIGQLEYLELWMIKGLNDVSTVSRIPSLRFVFLQSLAQVTELPSLADTAPETCGVLAVRSGAAVSRSQLGP